MQQDEIFGYIERITYQNPLNGYTVAQLKSSAQTDLICIVGVLPSILPGETVRCFGEWKNHLVHGRQFEVKNYQTEAPADLVGITKYLGSGLVKGIGPAYAKRIVAKFKEDTLEVIDKSPEKLLKIQGIGKKRVDLIRGCWHEQKNIREVMIFLQSCGISPTYAQKIFKAYGEASIEKVSDNPYNLARDIFGIGFKTADQIAEKMGIEKTSVKRIDAGIEFLLLELSNDGNVCFPLEEFEEVAVKTFEVDLAFIRERIDSLSKEQRIVLCDQFVEGIATPFIWSKILYLCEIGIAREVHRLNGAGCRLRKVDAPKAVEWVEEKLAIELADNQRKAVMQSLEEKVQIITGGPGTGKSTITNAILHITSKLTDQILLAAPTGRAAKRMTEITGRKASTIHSLLEFDFRTAKFKRNRKNPLECDLIIVDEASMIDTSLMYQLLKAIPHSARVIFVGDIDQLPSVGPGNVLKDMIASKQISVTELTEIFRQAKGSQIVMNAHRINKGEYPNLSNGVDSDFFFIEREDKQELLKAVVALVGERLPKKYGFHQLKDIQVMAPMKRGEIGTENLNTALQDTLNRNQSNPLYRAGRKYLVGDKVMQTRNDHKREVYNGDVGFIQSIDQVDQIVKVNFDGRDVEYTFSDLDELVLAYAVSVHKYQGSECPCVVMPVHTSHFKLLHRNLLYTGVTRGKRLVVLIGMKKALAIAVYNDEVKKRHTGLKEALLSEAQHLVV